jgi:3-dehydroquinate synthase
MLKEFSIEGKKYCAEFNVDNLESFTIKSVPRNYSVSYTDSNIVESVRKILDENSKNVLLIDRNVFNLHFYSMNDIDPERILLADATESFKTLVGVINVIDFLASRDITKGETLVVVGGGIIQDVGAFVGAAFKRGTKWIYFPTTLLSMCDSCIGGKTGINHNGAKNQVALFSSPSQVIINSNFIDTLSDKEILSGLGEIAKLLATGGWDFLQLFNYNVKKALEKDKKALKVLILLSLSVKKAVIEEDEFELSHRRVLNYGHTLGHAVESLSDYRIPHGQAVTIGMMVINELCVRHGIMSKEANRKLYQIFSEIVVPDFINELSVEDVLLLLRKDKKAVSENIFFAVLKDAGINDFFKIKIDDGLKVELVDIFKKYWGGK